MRQMTVSSSIHRQFWDTPANKVYADSKTVPQTTRALARLASTAMSYGYWSSHLSEQGLMKGLNRPEKKASTSLFTIS